MHARPFSPAALACLPVLPTDKPWAIEMSGGLAGRRDLRQSHLVCSVDPPGCQVRACGQRVVFTAGCMYIGLCSCLLKQDIDDALSARYSRLAASHCSNCCIRGNRYIACSAGACPTVTLKSVFTLLMCHISWLRTVPLTWKLGRENENLTRFLCCIYLSYLGPCRSLRLRLGAATVRRPCTW